MDGFWRPLTAPRVLLMLAAVSALIAGATVTAPAAQADGTCSWQALSLLNGWQSAQAAWSTGDPAFCLDNGVIYLHGSLTQPGGGSWEFAQLPAWATPLKIQYLDVYTFQGTTGVLRIDPSGAMYAYYGNATSFTSLAGVSFPSAYYAPQLLPLTLENGWYSADSDYGTGDPSYFVSGGIVHLAGSMASTESTPANGDFAPIPAAIQPDNCTEMNVYAYGGAHGLVSLWGNSDLSLFHGLSNDLFVQDTGQPVGETGPDTIQFTSLAGLAYPAAGAAWQPLALVNGFFNDRANCFNGDLSYVLNGGVVYLNGLILRSGSGYCEFAVLPTNIRPYHNLYFTVNAEGLANANVEISPDGTTCAWSNGQNGFVLASLGGISYQQSS